MSSHRCSGPRRRELSLCDVDEIVDPDPGSVDMLARLQLAARRIGCELRSLLALTGLDDVLLLTVEARRQPDERKEALGVEEEREFPQR